MGRDSQIEWTHHTFNPWIGCAKVHTGCEHCYAEADQDHRRGRAQWGLHGTRSRTSDANWQKPLAWNRAAEKAGERHRVFCASLADIFEDWDGPIVNHQGEELFIPDRPGNPPYNTQEAGAFASLTMDDMRLDLFALIDATPWLDWLLLTKRPENVRRMWPIGPGLPLEFRPNVWLGTSVSNQETADDLIPQILQARNLAPVLFLSAEPLVGAISFRWAKWQEFSRTPGTWTGHLDGLKRIDWVIVGGESGHHARPMHPDWVRTLRDECVEAGVPFFFKQWGEFAPSSAADGTEGVYRIDRLGIDLEDLPGLWDDSDALMTRCGKKAAGRRLDGRDWSEFPEVLIPNS